MREKFLPFSPPSIAQAEIDEVVQTLHSDWITTGPKVKQFEEEFAAYVGAPAALALNSCTAALQIALAVLNIGPGDAVITTPMTFCSGVNVIVHSGAVPLLVDVEPDTLNIDLEKIENLLNRLAATPNAPRVRAIMPVHLYGHPCEMDRMIAIARRHGLAIIEDAAHSLPASYKGRRIGTIPPDCDVPILTAYSFYATKNMTTAEGGALTGPRELIDAARPWSLHGMSKDAWKRYSAEGSWYYEVVLPGFKCNMTDIQASLGLHQLRRLDQFHARRIELVNRYSQAFSQLPGIQVPTARPEVIHAWHLYVIRLRTDVTAVNRNQMIEELRKRNIATSVHFIPIHLHPFYRDRYGWTPEDFPVSYREYQRMLSLPLSPALHDQDVEDVIGAVAEILRQDQDAAVPAQS